MRAHLKRITVLTCLLISASAIPVSALAQTWPSKLIKAYIPFGAGSATDVVPRMFFDRLATELGQPIVIENRAGAGGTVGTAAVVRSDPDGYSILAHSSAITIAPAITPALTYDATNDAS
jgi:tripartite-type tricarboxylate transporter receptor subunit TctC